MLAGPGVTHALVLADLRTDPAIAPSTAAKTSGPEAMQEDKAEGAAANGAEPSSEKKKKKKVRALQWEGKARKAPGWAALDQEAPSPVYLLWRCSMHADNLLGALVANISLVSLDQPEKMQH